MISIVICSRTVEADENLLINIEEHIGSVVYEVINIDNSENRYDIFQAYNIGVQKAQYPILCFMHDDILFHSYDWGSYVIDHFEDEQLGMLGVGGPRFLSRVPSIWWASNAHNKYSPSACQYSIDTERNTKVSIYQKIQPVDNLQIEVVALDGLFFCIRKSLFETVSFDEITYHGFHFYDLDISMQIRSAGFKICVIYDVLLEHISAGQLNLEWLRSARLFYRKWKERLPILTYKLTIKERRCLEYSNLRVMSDILLSNHISMISYFTYKEMLYLLKWCPKGFIKVIKKYIDNKKDS